MSVTYKLFSVTFLSKKVTLNVTLKLCETGHVLSIFVKQKSL